MTNELFNKLFNGGKYALPYLIKFSCGSNIIRLVNNNEDVTYNNETYTASSFDYTPPEYNGEGGSLDITGIESGLVEFLEEADSSIQLDVVGVLVENGEVQQLRQYQHFYGSVSFGEDLKISFQLARTDKLEIQFCPYKFDADNNRANV